VSATPWLAGIVAALVVASPRLARACAVCMSGREDDVQAAFIGTTVLLSVLPLIAVGAGLIWLRRRLRELERAEAEREGSAPPA
jgi:hypothetical protein